ncbi:MAG: WcaF family extracellular polysaccharide biosynthesis acetyltransferase [Bacteroidota bacterium]
METELNKFDNSWYWKNYNKSSFIKRIFWIIIGNTFINSYLPTPIFFKIWLLRLFGAKIGAHVVIKPKANIKFPWLLEIGEDCWIGEEVWIDNLAKVKIGNNVCISQGALLLTGNHDFTLSAFDLKIGEIIIENGVWIGAKSIVCLNVTCEDHSVLTVGSVTSKNLQSFGIYRGNPAELIKRRVITD